jgi:hypothetical protein
MPDALLQRRNQKDHCPFPLRRRVVPFDHFIAKAFSRRSICWHYCIIIIFVFCSLQQKAQEKPKRSNIVILPPSSSTEISHNNVKMNCDRITSAIECNNYAIDEIRRGNIRKAYALLMDSCNNIVHDIHHQAVVDDHSTIVHSISPTTETFRFGCVDCTEPITRKLHEDKSLSRSQDTSSTSFMYFTLVAIIDEEPWPKDFDLLRSPSSASRLRGFAWAVYYK